jgi:hypothetical protein
MERRLRYFGGNRTGVAVATALRCRAAIGSELTVDRSVSTCSDAATGSFSDRGEPPLFVVAVAFDDE